MSDTEASAALRQNPRLSARWISPAWRIAVVAMCILTLGGLALWGALAPRAADLTPLAAISSGTSRLTDGRLILTKPYLAIVGLLLVVATRRTLLSFLAWRGGAVEVRPLFGKQTDDTNLDELSAAFRSYLALPRVYETTTVPGDPEPDRLFKVLEPGTKGGWYAVLASAVAYALPARAFVVAATLRKRDGYRPFGVAVQVRRIPGAYVDLETQWSHDWEGALKRAAYVATAYILPHTAACRRAPWPNWRGKQIPPELIRNYQRAKDMVAERRYDDAMALYLHALRVDPDNIDMRFDVGQLHERLQQYPQALDRYIQITDELFPVRPRRVRLPFAPATPFIRRRTGRYTLFPTVDRDPFSMRYRFITVLGFAEHIAYEIWEEQATVTKDRHWQIEFRPWRMNETRDIAQRLGALMAERHGVLEIEGLSLDIKHLTQGDALVSLSEDQAKLHRWCIALYLLLAARQEQILLRSDMRRYRAVTWIRRRGRSRLTRHALKLQETSLDLRINRTLSKISALDSAVVGAIGWPPREVDYTRLLAEGGYRRKATNWQEHYYAACMLALPLLDLQTDEIDQSAFAGLAVRALERARSNDDEGQFLFAKSYWLFAGDPDLIGLRQSMSFRALEARVYGYPTPMVVNIYRYELYEYVRELLMQSAEHLERQWRDRRDRESATVAPDQVERWWREEHRAIRLAVRLGRFPHQSPTRHAVLRSLAKWTDDHGRKRPRIAFPNLVTSRRVGVEGIAAARMENMKEILDFLAHEVSSFAEVSPTMPVEVNTQAWRDFAAGDSRLGRSRTGLSPVEYESMCGARVGMWAAIRQWGEPMANMSKHDVVDLIRALPDPPKVASGRLSKRPRGGGKSHQRKQGRTA